MRTSFHHQSEAQPPNGRLTAATSPDTPSAAPTGQSVSNAYGIGSRLPMTIASPAIGPTYSAECDQVDWVRYLMTPEM